MNTKRLLKLADFLDTLPREKFDFGQIAVQAGKPMLEALKLGAVRCGTVACAIGWMPAVFPRALKWRNKRNIWGDSIITIGLRRTTRIQNFEVAAQWFDITAEQSDVLFMPETEGFGLRAISESAHPKVVARRIRRFVEKNARRRA